MPRRDISVIITHQRCALLVHALLQSCGWDEDARSDATATTIHSKTALSISGRTATTDDLPVTPRPGRVLSPRLSDAPPQAKTA